MRYRISNYSVLVEDDLVKLSFIKPMSKYSADDLKKSIRLVIDETSQKVLCSSMQKQNIIGVEDTSGMITLVFNTYEGVGEGNEFTIEVDLGDSVQEVLSSIETVKRDYARRTDIPTDYAKENTFITWVTSSWGTFTNAVQYFIVRIEASVAVLAKKSDLPTDYAKTGEYDTILARIEGKVSLTASDAIADWNA